MQSSCTCEGASDNPCRCKLIHSLYLSRVCSLKVFKSEDWHCKASGDSHQSKPLSWLSCISRIMEIFIAMPFQSDSTVGSPIKARRDRESSKPTLEVYSYIVMPVRSEYTLYGHPQLEIVHSQWQLRYRKHAWRTRVDPRGHLCLLYSFMANRTFNISLSHYIISLAICLTSTSDFREFFQWVCDKRK